MYALLELHIRLSILRLLNTVLHCYSGKHGAVHECGMPVASQKLCKELEQELRKSLGSPSACTHHGNKQELYGVAEIGMVQSVV
eukprot:1151540-Pelagomonas_calceolata.AAC.3